MLLKLKTQVIFSENDNHDIKMFTPERHALLIEQKLIAAVKKCIVTGYIVELATGAVVYQYFQFVFDEIGSTGKLLIVNVIEFSDSVSIFFSEFVALFSFAF